MNFPLRAASAVVAALAVSSALAHGEKGAEIPDGWSGSLAAGYVATSGNSDNSTANLQGQVNLDQGRWHHSALATGLGASSNNDSTAEAYKAQLKTKFDLNDTIYVFGLAEYNKDRFSAYDHQIFEAAGLGWRVYRSTTQELNLEAGVGATQSKLAQLDGCGIDPECLTSSERDAGGFIGRLGADYHWHLSDTALFSQKLSSTIGSDNTYLESNTELQANVVGNLALVLGYLVKYNTDVPAEVDDTDTQTSISLKYTF
jgi:putative salt-induced outer membrane protein